MGPGACSDALLFCSPPQRRAVAGARLSEVPCEVCHLVSRASDIVGCLLLVRQELTPSEAGHI